MSNGSGEIIIRAASAEVEFDHEVFNEEETIVGKRKKYKNSSKKITKVEITGAITFDSGTIPDGSKFKIVVHCT